MSIYSKDTHISKEANKKLIQVLNRNDCRNSNFCNINQNSFYVEKLKESILEANGSLINLDFLHACTKLIN